MSRTFEWTDFEVRRALGLSPESSDEAIRFTGVTTDSREVRPGELYVALKGDRFDGHDFVSGALEAGARGAVVSAAYTGAEEVPIPLYRVEDTLEALGGLASHRRRRLPARVVGITGSSGKTGTKDLTAAALAPAFRVHATRGNLNNRIGVPLTLLSAPQDAEVVVAEMGTSEPGEIAALTRIAGPDVAVLTTVGESHLQRLGSLAGVLSEKLSILEGLGGEGQAVVGDTPADLPSAARRVFPRARVAGWTERADAALRAVDPVVGPGGAYAFTWRGQRVSLGVPGRHSVTNALLALAVSEMLGVDGAAAARALATVRPGRMRGETLEVGSLTLLLDCYNANPQSVLAAADTLQTWPSRRRVAVLGSMLELGEEGVALHRRVLLDVLTRDIQLVLATGAFALVAEELKGRARGGPELVVVEEVDAGYARLKTLLRGDEVVLLKASRGVAMERLIPLFQADFGAGEKG